MQAGLIRIEDYETLMANEAPDVVLAENLIENVIGFFSMPMGVAAHFRIDGRDRAIPMAVEETSIIAAASKTAKWIRENGRIETKILGKHIIGQIQISRVTDFSKFKAVITENKSKLIARANEVCVGLLKRGGGVQDITVREVLRGNDSGSMAVIHVLADPCDAMGANLINQVCEALKPMVEALSRETVTMCILSNLTDTKLTQAKVVIETIDPDLAERIQEASLFAKQDPYRAATNNKGVLNGMDAVLLATGNDWRAVEAGVHAYAAREGQYRSITNWTVRGKTLEGTLVAPVVVGTVGGVTKVHPSAQMSLKMLDVKSSEELSRIVAAVGLVQNLGALRALTTVGVVEGHMKLHAVNLAMAAGAQKDEMLNVQTILEEILKRERRVTLTHAIEALEKIRSERSHGNHTNSQ